jgi:hypothetical protein
MPARRSIALLLAFVLAPLLATAQDRPQGKTVRLLTVGNSFSQNATRYLDGLRTSSFSCHWAEP